MTTNSAPVERVSVTSPPDARASEARVAGEEPRSRNRFLWERNVNAVDGPSGAALSAIRRGAGQEPGSVPGMWPFQVNLNGDFFPDAWTVAEHHALVLFGFHQQGLVHSVHSAEANLAGAVWSLRGRYSPDAVDTRFFRAVTATDIDEVAHHLRGLIMQMRSMAPVPRINYTQLVRDLHDWQFAQSVDRVRRRWGSQYPSRTQSTTTTK